MAKMTTAEAKAFLKDVGLTDDQLGGYTDAHLKKIADGLMRQNDYDQTMNAGKQELSAAQARLEEANNRLTAEMAEWGRVQATDSAQAAQMRKEKERAEADVLRLTQTLSRVASEHGLDPTKILGDVTPPPPTTPMVNLDGYVKAEQMTQHVDGLASLSLRFPTELMALAIEHQQLFGKPMDPTSLSNELEKRAKTPGNRKTLDLRQIWEEQNKVPEARQAAEKKRWDDAMAEAEARGRTAAISESSIPGSVNAPGKHAPVFQGNRQSALNRPQPNGTINAAVAAFRTGKYRVPSTAGSAPRT